MQSEWEAIVPPTDAGAVNVRRADIVHPLDFRIGRDYRGRYIFQLDAVSPAELPSDMPRIAGIGSDLEPAGEGCSRLVLTLNHASDFRNFALMCSGLMIATADLAPEASAAGLLRAIEELHRWQEMLRRRKDRVLKRPEIIGLVGELLFLRDILATRLGYATAVRCWNGPGGDEQDFVVGNAIIEVKTQIVTADRRIRISSEDQLDPVQGRIFICNQGLAPVPPVEEAARTLNSLVSEIREAVAPCGGGAAELLEIALLAASYEERPEYDEESWILVDRAWYEVAGDFPRIERGDLRAGVDTVKYSIRVNDCLPFAVDEEDAFGGQSE
jgi:hypothetical protein